MARGASLSAWDQSPKRQANVPDQPRTSIFRASAKIGSPVGGKLYCSSGVVMDDSKRKEYGGLPGLKGVQFIPNESRQQLTCPVCTSTEVAVLSGKIGFEVMMSGEAYRMRVAACLCDESHIFFLPARDVNLMLTDLN